MYMFRYVTIITISSSRIVIAVVFVVVVVVFASKMWLVLN